MPYDSRAKRALEVLQSILTIAALILGGAWFLAQESLKPSAVLSQTVTTRQFGADYNQVAIDVRIKNEGKVKVPLRNGTLTLYEINPEDEGDAQGNSVALSKPFPLRDLDLEPGESDQSNLIVAEVPKRLLTLRVRVAYPAPRRWFWPWGRGQFYMLDSIVDTTAVHAPSEKTQN